MKKISGAQAIITGAASGIGRAIARELAAAGADVYLIDMDRRRLEQTADELESFAVDVRIRVCDLSNIEQLERTAFSILYEWPHANVLINNAGVTYFGPTAAMSREDCCRVLDVNLNAAIHLSRIFLPGMIQLAEASIINISSMYGLFGGRRLAVYSASKFALIGFTQSLRNEYGRAGLSAGVICPGFVNTDFFSSAANGFDDRLGNTPPWWVCTSPERVAGRVVMAIRRNRRMVVVTPLARAVDLCQRYAPWLIDGLYQIGKVRRLRKLKKLVGDDQAVNESNQAATRRAA